MAHDRCLFVLCDQSVSFPRRRALVQAANRMMRERQLPSASRILSMISLDEKLYIGLAGFSSSEVAADYESSVNVGPTDPLPASSFDGFTVVMPDEIMISDQDYEAAIAEVMGENAALLDAMSFCSVLLANRRLATDGVVKVASSMIAAKHTEKREG